MGLVWVANGGWNRGFLAAGFVEGAAERRIVPWSEEKSENSKSLLETGIMVVNLKYLIDQGESSKF